MLINVAANQVGPDVFYSQYLWFVTFGVLILLYVIAAAIKRARAPKGGERRMHVRIEAINKLRVPVEVFNRARQMTNNTTIPVSFWEVSFRNDDTNEAYSFSVKESECEGFNIDDKGILKFNGGNFISFVREG